MLHPDVSTFWEHHIYIGIKFSRPLPMYLTATYIGVTHIRRIPMYPTMICAGKDFDGDSLGRGLLLMINFPRGSSFLTKLVSAQLIPTTKQYLCTRVMSGISGTSVLSPQQITPWRECRIRDFGYISIASGRYIIGSRLG